MPPSHLPRTSVSVDLTPPERTGQRLGETEKNLGEDSEGTKWRLVRVPSEISFVTYKEPRGLIHGFRPDPYTEHQKGPVDGQTTHDQVRVPSQV